MELLKQQIENIKDAMFWLDMKDHWSSEDDKKYDNYVARLNQLQAQLKALVA